MPAIHYPPLIQWRRDACNGMYPSAKFLKNIVDGENHLTAHRHKEVFSADWRLNPTFGYSGYAGTTTLRRFRFRSGHGAVKLRAMVILGKVDPGTGAVAPTTKIDVTLSGGGTTTLGPWSHALSLVDKFDAPSGWLVSVATITIAANSVYECAVTTSDFGRPLGISVVEIGAPTIAESTLYYNQSNPQAGGPLFDADRSRLLVGIDGMLRHNGATMWHFGKFDGTARTRTSATGINLIDNATTGSPTTASPGYHLDLTYRHTASRTTVPVELSVYGACAAGGTGTVAIVDTSGTAHVTCTVNSAATGWFTGTGTLPSTGGKFDFKYTGDGTHLLTVYAVSAAMWEA